MRTRTEDIVLPCQYCGKLERRAPKSANRAATCFDCRAARIRKAARAQLTAERMQRDRSR
jgi:hypothetical protein